MKRDFQNLIKQVNTFIFDVDGVLTDGRILVTESGELLRSLNVKDGYALQLAARNGYRIAIITGANTPGIAIRLKNLGVQDIFMKISDKIKVYDHYLKDNLIQAKETLFMADDIPDIEVYQKAGVRACPKDASSLILGLADYISPYKGGEGCVRDIIELVMDAQGKWMNDHSHIW